MDNSILSHLNGFSLKQCLIWYKIQETIPGMASTMLSLFLEHFNRRTETWLPTSPRACGSRWFWASQLSLCPCRSLPRACGFDALLFPVCGCAVISGPFPVLSCPAACLAPQLLPLPLQRMSTFPVQTGNATGSSGCSFSFFKPALKLHEFPVMTVFLFWLF